MNAVEGALFFLAKPRVVHTLPGRLRLHAPFLKGSGREHEDLVSLTANLLTTPEGIHAVSPCLVTGNVLIRYDAARLSEEEVLDFLSSLLKIVVAHRAHWPKAREQDLATLERKLRNWLSRSLSHGLHLDSRLRIPADVFT